MTTFKKALFVAILAGLGLSFMPQAKAEKMSESRKAYEAVRHLLVVGGTGTLVAGASIGANIALWGVLGLPVNASAQAAAAISGFMMAGFAMNEVNQAEINRWNNMGLSWPQQEEITDYIEIPLCFMAVAGLIAGAGLAAYDGYHYLMGS